MGYYRLGRTITPGRIVLAVAALLTMLAAAAVR